MAALFGPRFALSVALFAALRGGLAGGVGFRECLADGRRYALRFALKLLKSRRKGANHAGVGCKPGANLRGLGLHLSH